MSPSGYDHTDIPSSSHTKDLSWITNWFHTKDLSWITNWFHTKKGKAKVGFRCPQGSEDTVFITMTNSIVASLEAPVDEIAIWSWEKMVGEGNTSD
jgi:hypothetical protein